MIFWVNSVFPKQRLWQSISTFLISILLDRILVPTEQSRLGSEDCPNSKSVAALTEMKSLSSHEEHVAVGAVVLGKRVDVVHLMIFLCVTYWWENEAGFLLFFARSDWNIEQKSGGLVDCGLSLVYSKKNNGNKYDCKIYTSFATRPFWNTNQNSRSRGQFLIILHRPF